MLFSDEADAIIKTFGRKKVAKAALALQVGIEEEVAAEIEA
jgi:hypothetical protein